MTAISTGQADAMINAAKWGAQLFFDHRFECYHCRSDIHLSNNQQTARQPQGEVGVHNTGLYTVYPETVPVLIEIIGKPQDTGRFRAPSVRRG
jgi:cytochrome c peroxidase